MEERNRHLSLSEPDIGGSSCSFVFYSPCQEGYHGGNKRVPQTHLFTLQASQKRAALDPVRKETWVRD